MSKVQADRLRAIKGGERAAPGRQPLACQLGLLRCVQSANTYRCCCSRRSRALRKKPQGQESTDGRVAVLSHPFQLTQIRRCCCFCRARPLRTQRLGVKPTGGCSAVLPCPWQLIWTQLSFFPEEGGCLENIYLLFPLRAVPSRSAVGAATDRRLPCRSVEPMAIDSDHPYFSSSPRGGDIFRHYKKCSVLRTAKRCSNRKRPPDPAPRRLPVPKSP